MIERTDHLVDGALADLVEAMTAVADPVRAPQMQAYMKDRFEFLGVPAPERRRVARPFMATMQGADRTSCSVAAERSVVAAAPARVRLRGGRPAACERRPAHPGRAGPGRCARADRFVVGRRRPAGEGGGRHRPCPPRRRRHDGPLGRRSGPVDRSGRDPPPVGLEARGGTGADLPLLRSAGRAIPTSSSARRSAGRCGTSHVRTPTRSAGSSSRIASPSMPVPPCQRCRCARRRSTSELSPAALQHERAAGVGAGGADGGQVRSSRTDRTVTVGRQERSSHGHGSSNPRCTRSPGVLCCSDRGKEVVQLNGRIVGTSEVAGR